jgi:5-formyltetrahydrofolate cyclo-ligase
MKEEIRKKILLRRNSLSDSEIIEKSKQIESRLLAVDYYIYSKNVMSFASFNSEVNTHDIIRRILKSKKLSVPKVDNGEIEPSLVIDFDGLIPSGQFGILEPLDLIRVKYKTIDLVLVPGVAFDVRGNRIGYGFGYYDKFLKKVPKAVKIGLAFEFQITEEIPIEEHDVPMDFIVTEKRAIDCKKYH